jgi:hypothetical protein
MVFAVSVYNAKAYVAGSFTSIGGLPIKGLACIDTATGLATTWNPRPNTFVSTMVFNGARLYAGGSFGIIGGQARPYIGCIDTAGSGSATTWNPNANSDINILALNATKLIAGGSFSIIGGQTRNNIACLSTDTGLATNWNPNANGSVSAILVNGENVYAGGNFDTIGGQKRKAIGCLDTNTGLATSWNPISNGAVLALTADATNLYVGGSFTNIGGVARPYFAQFAKEVTVAINNQQNVIAGFVNSNGYNISIKQSGIIRYDLSQMTQTSISIFDIKGRLCWSIVNKNQSAGHYSVSLYNNKIKTGLFLVKFRAGSFEQTKSIIILR